MGCGVRGDGVTVVSEAIGNGTDWGNSAGTEVEVAMPVPVGVIVVAGNAAAFMPSKSFLGVLSSASASSNVCFLRRCCECSSFSWSGKVVRPNTISAAAAAAFFLAVAGEMAPARISMPPEGCMTKLSNKRVGTPEGWKVEPGDVSAHG